MTELFYSCGLRSGELASLDVQASAQSLAKGRGWIDLDACDAHVQGKGSKRRILPIGAAAVEIIACLVAAAQQACLVSSKYRPGRTRHFSLAGAVIDSVPSPSGRAYACVASMRAWRPGCIRMCCATRLPATYCSPVICARRAGAAGPCQHFHNPDLYATRFSASGPGLRERPPKGTTQKR